MGAGDGSPGGRLRPLRRWEVLHRALYTVELGQVAYTAEVDLGRDDGKAVLYADGVEQAAADMPAAFPVPGGTIEVDTGLYGVRRVHLVLGGGREERLRPVAGTLEDRRARLDRRRPGVSRAIAWTAAGVLAANLVLALPQAVELVTALPKVAAAVGTFTSPVNLPAWLNFTLVLAGALAAAERLLTLRQHRVLDAETIWTNL